MDKRDKYIVNIYGVKMEVLMNAPLEKTHKQRLHNINGKKKPPIHMNGSFVFFLGRCFSRLFGSFKKL